MIGKTVSHYRIIEQPGTGGLGRLQCKAAAYSDFPTAKENRTDERLKAFRPGRA